MPFLREVEETNLVHQAADSLVQVRTARDALKRAVGQQVGQRVTELARAMAHDVLHGCDYVYRTIAASALASLVQDPDACTVVRSDHALRGLPQRLLGSLREAGCLSRDAGHPLSPHPSPESQRFVVYYAAIFASLTTMASQRKGASDLVRDNTLQELAHFAFLHKDKHLKNFNIELPEARLRFSHLLRPVLVFLAALLTQTVAASGDPHTVRDMPGVGRLVLAVLEAMKPTVLHVLNAGDIPQGQGAQQHAEAVEVVLEEVHLLTLIACHLAACGVLHDDDTVTERTEMVHGIKAKMRNLLVDVQRVSHTESAAHHGNPPQSVVGLVLMKMPFGSVSSNASTLALHGETGEAPSMEDMLQGNVVPPKQRLLALRIAANLCSFQLTLMNWPRRLYSQESNVLAPYFFQDAQGTEVSHAGELLLFAKFALNLFNQHQAGNGEHESHEDLRKRIEEGSTVQDVYAIPMAMWVHTLLQVERELSALAYIVETAMAMSLQMFKECKEGYLQERLRPNPNNIYQRALRVNEAERRVKVCVRMQLR